MRQSLRARVLFQPPRQELRQFADARLRLIVAPQEALMENADRGCQPA
jgi:hypothetical protein